jgi:PAS domain S-box-containing protein
MELAEKEDQRTRAEAEVEVLSRFAAENPNPVLRAERNGGLLYANDAALALLPGWELMVGRPLPTAVSQAVRQAIDTEVGRVIEVQLGHRTFSVFIAPVEEAGYAILYAFDITELRDRDVSLRKLGERFQSTFEQAAVGMAHVAPDNRLLRVNRRLCEILGYSHGELLERGLQDITHPDEVERDRLSMEHLLSGARRSYSVEKRYIRKDGSAIWANLTTSLAQAADGKPAYFISVIEDISERKQGEEEIRRLNAELEERVTLRTAQLQSANEELEAFSYSVSHDLRAPLRGIDGWSLALLEDYGDQLDVQAREYLGRVRAETQRMGELIDDLLQLSRVSRAQMQHGPIDLTDLAERVIARLREAQPERRIEVAVEPGLAALGDPRLLEVVLTNLLDNAWKFTRATPNPTIEVGRMEVNATHAFYVRDNGAGFDMVFADKLFGVFQRLHKPSEFPGTGVGLATIQRIIRRHGGEVWADSQTGQGATFYFTLPEVE